MWLVRLLVGVFVGAIAIGVFETVTSGSIAHGVVAALIFFVTVFGVTAIVTARTRRARQ